MSHLLNYHVRHSINIGDWFSSPLLYFDFPGFQTEAKDIDDLPQEKLQNQHLILGGGGLLFPRFLEGIQHLKNYREQGQYIFWGVGQQSYKDPSLTFAQFDYRPYVESVDLLGIRDYGVGLNWVPCVSCMHQEFDRPRVPQHEVVVFSHKKFRIQVPGLPTLTNESMDFRTVLDFLGSGETILTSSFHGAYWGTLLGRKVIAFPFTSKFYGLKHLPVLYPVKKWKQKSYKLSLFGKTLYQSTDPNWFECEMDDWRSWLSEGQNYPSSLQECRDRNQDFYQQVLDLLT